MPDLRAVVFALGMISGSLVVIGACMVVLVLR